MPETVKATYMDVVGRPQFLEATPAQQLEALRILSTERRPAQLEALRQLIVNDPEIKGAAYGTVANPPTTMEKAKGYARSGAPIAGGMAGATLGTLLAGPGGGIVGAGIGAGGAELGAQKLAGEETDYGAAAIEGVSSMAGEGAGRLLLRGTSRVLAQFMRRPPRGPGEAAYRFLEPYAAKVGAQAPMRPAQATESRVIDIMQNIAEGSLLGGGKLQRMATEVEPQTATAAVYDIIESAGAYMDADQLAAAFRAAQEGRITARDLLIQPLYNSIDNATGTVVKKVPVKRTVTEMVDTGVMDAAGNPIRQPVSRTITEMVEREVSPVNADLAKLKHYAKPLAEQAKRLKKVGSAGVADDEIIKIADMSDEVPFGDVAELRSRLLAIQRELQLQPGASKKAIGRIGALIRMTDDAAERALKEQAPDMYATWRSASKAVGKRERDLNNALVRKLIVEADPKMVGVAGGGKPEALVRDVFQSPTRARAVQKMLGGGSWRAGKATPEWEALQRGYVTTLLKADPSTGQFSGKALKAALAKNSQMLDVLDPELKRNLITLSDAIVAQQGKQASGVGRAAVQFGQYGQLFGGGGLAAALLFDRSKLVDPRYSGPASVALLTPPMLAFMLTNKYTAKLLIKAASTKTSTKAMAGIGGQLMMAAARAREDLGLPELPKSQPPPRLGAF